MEHHHHHHQMDKVRRVEGHQCGLPIEEKLVEIYIDSGACVDFRRRFRQRMLVSPSNPETQSFLRSSAQIYAEKVKHLRHYYHMIHPFSETRSIWETIMIVVYLAHYFLMPIEPLIPVRKRGLIFYLKFTCDVFSLIDIVLFFFTGFHDVGAGKIIMNPRKVAKHYLFRFFIFDLLSSFPFSFVLVHSGLYKTNLYRLKYFCLFRLCRLPTLTAYVRKFCVKMDVLTFRLKTVSFCFHFVIVIWWSTCLTCVVFVHASGYAQEYFEQQNIDIFGLLLHCCYNVIKPFMLVAISKIQSSEELSMIFNLLCLFFGSVLNIIIFSIVIKIYSRHANAKNKYDQLIQEIGEYMDYKELTPQLKNKILRYVEFKYQKNIFEESDILLSKILREDVVLHNCKKMLERVDFFKGLPSALILRIVTKLRSEIYLPKDIIVQAGVVGNAMYFIYMGTVAVYTSTDREICHLEEGSHFGEISLIINEPRVATVVAVTNCEVFRLSRKDYLEAMEPYPKLSNNVKKLAMARLTSTKMIVMSEEMSPNLLESHG